MNAHELGGPGKDTPDRTGAEGFGDWLTVSEAVIYCSLFGLSRTPKTIRKWAQRSFGNPESAELEVRREDVTHGFRWSVSRSSLDRKIEQELEFEARASDERGQPGTDQFAPVRSGSGTGASDISEDHQPEPSQTRPTGSAPVRDSGEIVDELRRQIDRLENEIAFYREELIDRRQSATALVDVIRAFRLNAETNAESSRDRARVQPNPQKATSNTASNRSADEESDTDGNEQRTINLQIRSAGDNAGGMEDYRV